MRSFLKFISIISEIGAFADDTCPPNQPIGLNIGDKNMLSPYIGEEHLFLKLMIKI